MILAQDPTLDLPDPPDPPDLPDLVRVPAQDLAQMIEEKSTVRRAESIEEADLKAVQAEVEAEASLRLENIRRVTRRARREVLVPVEAAAVEVVVLLERIKLMVGRRLSLSLRKKAKVQRRLKSVMGTKSMIREKLSEN